MKRSNFAQKPRFSEITFEISIFEFFDFLHEVRTLKALQTGIEVALAKYLFYGQLGGQKGSIH